MPASFINGVTYEANYNVSGTKNLDWLQDSKTTSIPVFGNSKVFKVMQKVVSDSHFNPGGFHEFYFILCGGKYFWAEGTHLKEIVHDDDSSLDMFEDEWDEAPENILEHG